MGFDFKGLKDKLTARAAEAQETFGAVAKKAGAYAEEGIKAVQAADKVVTDFVTEKAKEVKDQIDARIGNDVAANDEKPAAPAKKAGGKKGPKA